MIRPDTCERKGTIKTQENQDNDGKGNTSVRPNGCHDEKEQYFEDVLTDLQGSTSFPIFKEKCEHYSSLIGDVDMSVTNPSFQTHHADLQSSFIMPRDIPVVTDDVIPLKVPAAGDCLPCTASMFAFGNDRHANEMRARIVIKLAS